jgi:hypothetical protein
MLDLVFRGRALVFETALGVDEVTRRLAREVVPPKWQFRETRTQLFEGTFSDGRFHMVRLVRGRNSFRPLIDGSVTPGSKGARVDVVLRLHPLVLGLCAVLFAVGALVATVAGAESLTTGTTSPGWLFSGALVLVFLVFLVATVVEARTATRLLATLFEAAPSRPRGGATA